MQAFDLVLSGGVVVNQDGVGARDIGVRDGLIADIGDLSRADAGERIDCRGLTILPGVIDSPGAFPRARPRAQGRPGDRSRARPCSAA